MFFILGFNYIGLNFQLDHTTLANELNPIIGIPRIMLQLMVLNVCFGLFHYLCHKNKWLFANIHYKHHELDTAHGAGAIYCHPIEQIFVNLLPVFLALIFTRNEFYWSCLFVIYVSYETVMGHTPFERKKSSRHNLHHSFYTVNFGNFPYLLDKYVFGTYRSKE